MGPMVTTPSWHQGPASVAHHAKAEHVSHRVRPLLASRRGELPTEGSHIGQVDKGLLPDLGVTFSRLSGPKMG